MNIKNKTLAGHLLNIVSMTWKNFLKMRIFFKSKKKKKFEIEKENSKSRKNFRKQKHFFKTAEKKYISRCKIAFEMIKKIFFQKRIKYICAARKKHLQRCEICLFLFIYLLTLF